MLKKFKATIVIPTIREESIVKFFSLWKKEFKGHRIIVVEDNPNKSFPLPKWVEHYSWKDIDSELGTKSWIIPRRSDCVRSYGYYKAWQKKCDFVVTMDDDCYPEASYTPSFLESIWESLSVEYGDDRWWSTLKGDIIPRGYPYDIRNQKIKTVIHHGLWSNVPDFDALTQQKFPNYRTEPARKVEKVPYGKYFPMCGMNLAFRPEVIPALYFLLMGKMIHDEKLPYDRFGDIWAGIFIKKICDHLNFAITSGYPSVHHSRASSIEANLRKETPGYPVNEKLWRKVDKIILSKMTFGECYKEIADNLEMNGEYWTQLKKAMNIWSSLFDNER